MFFPDQPLRAGPPLVGKFNGTKRHGPAGKALATAVAGGVPGFSSVKFWGYTMIYTKKMGIFFVCHPG